MIFACKLSDLVSKETLGKLGTVNAFIATALPKDGEFYIAGTLKLKVLTADTLLFFSEKVLMANRSELAGQGNELVSPAVATVLLGLLQEIQSSSKTADAQQIARGLVAGNGGFVFDFIREASERLEILEASNKALLAAQKEFEEACKSHDTERVKKSSKEFVAAFNEDRALYDEPKHTKDNLASVRAIAEGSDRKPRKQSK